MNMLAKSFPCLIDALVRLHYGTEVELWRESGISTSTIWRWRRRALGTYAQATIEKLALATGYKGEEIWEVIYEDQRKRRHKLPVSLPDLSDVGPGPPRKYERRHARAVGSWRASSPRKAGGGGRSGKGTRAA